MKENSDNNNDIENHYIKEININKNNLKKFRRLLNMKNCFLLHINSPNSINIDIHRYSFFKINQMINSNPEENIIFNCNQKELYSPNYSSNFTKNSNVTSRNNSSSLSDCSQIQILNANNNNEETINRNENIFRINNNIPKEKHFLEKKNKNNNNNYIKSSENNENIFNNKNIKFKNFNNRRFFLFKWIYHFYLINGMIILLHYISFIVSKYNNSSFYKLAGILLIFCLIYFGYIGIKNKNKYFNILNYNNIRNYLFRINLIIFIVSIISFIGIALIGGKFKFIRNQGIIGFFIIIIYLIIIIVETIYMFNFDLINREIIYNYSKNEDMIYELSVKLYNFN